MAALKLSPSIDTRHIASPTAKKPWIGEFLDELQQVQSDIEAEWKEAEAWFARMDNDWPSYAEEDLDFG